MWPDQYSPPGRGQPQRSATPERLAARPPVSGYSDCGASVARPGRPGTQRVTVGAESCAALPTTVGHRFRAVQAIEPSARLSFDLRAAMVRKASPVRVRQRASQTVLQRGVLVFGASWVTTSGPSGRGRQLRSAKGRLPVEPRTPVSRVAHPGEHPRLVLSRVPSGYRFVEDCLTTRIGRSPGRRHLTLLGPASAWVRIARAVWRRPTPPGSRPDQERRGRKSRVGNPHERDPRRRMAGRRFSMSPVAGPPHACGRVRTAREIPGIAGGVAPRLMASPEAMTRERQGEVRRASARWLAGRPVLGSTSWRADGQPLLRNQWPTGADLDPIVVYEGLPPLHARVVREAAA
jgi:hypothetical protein